MIDRGKFYKEIRPLFGGKLTQLQVDGMEAILDEAERRSFDNRWTAYIMATAFHETGQAMQPVKEKGGNPYFIRRYWENEKVRKALGNTSMKDAVNYCGKGFVQITGRNNYERFAHRLKIPLLDDPDQALTVVTGIQIMFDGMEHGLFTGASLLRYFNSRVTDWVDARRIVNGTDKADLIAGYAHKFYAAIV